MKVISFIFLFCYINLISGFLNFPENEPSEGLTHMAEISSSQEYDDTKVKLIETNFNMTYLNYYHFSPSNSPVAPRTDGGYYIAFTDTNKYLHVLSYDKNDKLLKDFNIKEKANPVDITATENGFAIYMVEADSTFHSYLSLYNKSFKLVKKVQIMNNSKNDDKTVDSNLQKQIIKYDTKGKPVFGMRFMYHPDSGKLIYSGGRIVLIFSHYNYFLDDLGTTGAHTGDTTVTFDNTLNDMDFGLTWGASHSLIQSVTADENYFCTAALSDSHPMGIQVTYTSKTKFKRDIDPINNKQNQREYTRISNLAGIISGYRNGYAAGKLGGILYFEKYGIYCLVYAKTPNDSEDSYNGKHIIYMTTWKFENNRVSNNKTMIVKVLSSGNITQVRAGKFGDDKVFITYASTSDPYDFYLYNGATPNFFLIDVSKSKKLKSDVKLNKLLMNVNEDLRTFEDGVLIWATANKEGKLSIIKIGTVNY